MGKQKECQHHLLSCYLVFNFTTYTSLPVFTRKSHQSRIGCFREGSHSSGGAGWSRGGRRPTVGWPCIILSRNTMGDVIGSSCLCVCAGLPERAAEPLATGLRQPHRGAEPVPKGGLVLWPEGQSPEDCHPGNVYFIGAHFNWCRLNKYHPWSVICAAVLQASVRQFGDPVLPQQICSHHWYPWHIWSVKIFFHSWTWTMCKFCDSGPCCLQAGWCTTGSGPCVQTHDLYQVKWKSWQST